jgi:heat shock protein HslJ
MRTLTVLLFLLFALPACNSGSDSHLLSTKWTFIGIRHSDTGIMELLPANLKGMNVVFSQDNKLHAHSSCNVFDGNWLASDPNSLKIDNLGTTKMFCPDDSKILWESRYYDGFKSSETFDITGDTLTITTSSKIAMIFKTE